VPTKPRVYMDSCCFIELALQSIGKHEAAREDDLWHLKELLNTSFDEEIQTLTSTLSIAECTHAKGDVSDDVKTLFKRFLTSGRYVVLIQDSVLVSERARNLRWAHGLAFAGADAIHIASALELKCDEFLTWDDQVHARATALDALGLPVRFPRHTSCLPDRYRQQSIPGLVAPAPRPILPAHSTSVTSNEASEENNEQ
jgi:predicted nucleic acid-binding protein